MGTSKHTNWWRVIRVDGHTNWIDRDPRDLLDGAWQDAKVEGPFVLATRQRGGVDPNRPDCESKA